MHKLLTLAVLSILGLALVQPAMADETPDFGVDMPTTLASGSSFPTAETTVNSWVFGSSPDVKAQYKHGWDIWAGLTSATTGGAVFGISAPLIYQTWWSPTAILKQLQGHGSTQSLLLAAPRQHRRGGAVPSIMDTLTAPQHTTKPDTSIAVAVAYSPPSADHVYTNKLLLTETLFSYLEEGYTSIPLFPKATVNVKPVYKLITSNNVSDTGIYVMPEWPGTPDVSKWTSDQRKAGYGPDLWPGCVYVQTLVMGPPGAEPSNTGCQNSQPSVLPSVDDFIHIKITAADMAHFATIEGSSVALTVGDVLILVGMHVTTREADRWTWQTFWWTATPHEPKAPSSKAIAKARPTILKAKDSTKHLKNAAGHYAMAVAYSMLSPAQPLIGGADIGSLVPAYNPHLEAGFGTGTFGLTAQVTTLEGPVTTDLGVQSNCMTCHGLAGYTTDNPVYAANYYVPRNDPALAGGLDLDFAWSILSVAKPK